VCGEDCASEAEERVTVVGEADHAGISRDEGAACGVFELADVLADRRLAQLQQLGRAGEAQRLSDRDEGAEQNRVEHIVPFPA
jgi:hypothetical protein